MDTSNEWEAFFDACAPQYMGEPFTHGTQGEVDFLVELLDLPSGATILDVGCGTGRHAVELARRGFRVTGLDLSRGMLAEARRAADEAGVRLELVKADATGFALPGEFDAAVCLCEGAFTLLGAADDPSAHDLAILRRIHAALRASGSLVLTALSAFRVIRGQGADPEAPDFDPLTMVETEVMEWEGPDGSHSMPGRQRVYVPTELTLLCRMAGFEVEHVWGGTAGAWGRRPLDLDEYEIMVVARALADGGGREVAGG